MTRTELAHRRLMSQYIAYRTHANAREVVAHLGAIQAQDYASALWAIGLRTQDMTRSDVEVSLARGEIVRSWPMRGTLHIVLAEDLRWMLKLMTPRVLSGVAARERSLELDEAVFKKAFQVLEAQLQDGKPHRRAQLLAALESAGIQTANQRGYHILWRAAQMGYICLGPMDGKQPTFVWLDAWIKPVAEISHEESLARIVERYIIGHGPATMADMMNWTKLPKGQLEIGLAQVQSKLNTATIDGAVYWFDDQHPKFSYDTERAVLLPAFDEYVLGYKDRSATLQAEHMEKIIPGNNGMFMATIVIDGQNVGIWKRTITAKQIKILLLPFEPLSRKQLTAIEKTAHQYNHFYGLPVVISQ